MLGSHNSSRSVKFVRAREDYGAFLRRLRRMKNVLVIYSPISEQLHYDMSLRLNTSCRLTRHFLNAISMYAKKKNTKSSNSTFTPISNADYWQQQDTDTLHVSCSPQWLQIVLHASADPYRHAELFPENHKKFEQIVDANFFATPAGACALAQIVQQHPKKRDLIIPGLAAGKVVVRLGQRVIIVGKVGIDLPGNELRAVLRKHRIYGKLLYSQHYLTSTDIRIDLPKPWPCVHFHPNLSHTPSSDLQRMSKAVGKPWCASQAFASAEVTPSLLAYSKVFYCNYSALQHTNPGVLLRLMALAKKEGSKVAISLDSLAAQHLFLNLNKQRSLPKEKELFSKLLSTHIDYLFLTKQSFGILLPILLPQLPVQLVSVADPANSKIVALLAQLFGCISIIDDGGVHVISHFVNYYFPCGACRVGSVEHGVYDLALFETINAIILQSLMAGEPVFDIKQTLDNVESYRFA